MKLNLKKEIILWTSTNNSILHEAMNILIKDGRFDNNNQKFNILFQEIKQFLQCKEQILQKGLYFNIHIRSMNYENERSSTVLSRYETILIDLSSSRYSIRFALDCILISEPFSVKYSKICL